MTNLATSLSIFCFVAAAVAVIALLITTQNRRLTESVEHAVNEMQVELKREIDIQDVLHARARRDINDLELQMMALSREFAKETQRIDKALDGLSKAVIRLEKVHHPAAANRTDRNRGPAGPRRDAG